MSSLSLAGGRAVARSVPARPLAVIAAATLLCAFLTAVWADPAAATTFTSASFVDAQKTKRTRDADGRVVGEERSLTIDAGFGTPLQHTNCRWCFRTIAADREGGPADTQFRLAGSVCDGGDVFVSDDDTVCLPALPRRHERR